MTEIYSPVGANVGAQSATAKFALGTRAYGQDDREFVYVVASGAVTLGDAVGIDEDFTAISLTTTTAAAMHKVGWAANHAFTTACYGFVTVKGTNFNGRLADNSAADSPLYTTATAGVLSTDSSTADPVKVTGVTCVAVTSTGGASQLIATYPIISE
jgi:hypothetical protein